MQLRSDKLHRPRYPHRASPFAGRTPANQHMIVEVTPRLRKQMKEERVIGERSPCNRMAKTGSRASGSRSPAGSCSTLSTRMAPKYQPRQSEQLASELLGSSSHYGHPGARRRLLEHPCAASEHAAPYSACPRVAGPAAARRDASRPETRKIVTSMPRRRTVPTKTTSLCLPARYPHVGVRRRELIRQGLIDVRTLGKR